MERNSDSGKYLEVQAMTCMKLISEHLVTEEKGDQLKLGEVMVAKSEGCAEDVQ